MIARPGFLRRELAERIGQDPTVAEILTFVARIPAAGGDGRSLGNPALPDLALCPTLLSAARQKAESRGTGKDDTMERPSELIYALDEQPPWTHLVGLGFQHMAVICPYLVMVALVVEAAKLPHEAARSAIGLAMITIAFMTILHGWGRSALNIFVPLSSRRFICLRA